MKYEIITKEVPIKGKCYIVCRELEGTSLFSAIDELCAKAAEFRAPTVYFACRDKSFDMDAMQLSTDSFLLDFYSDFDFLERDVRDAQFPKGLTMQPLSPENAELFMQHLNAAFFDVPNGATTDSTAIDEMLSSPKCDAGLFMDKFGVCGTYELFFDGEVPEISTLCVNTRRQGCGLGKMELQALKAYILSKGYTRCKLLVASENRRAYSLYLKDGFTFSKRSSRWYTVHPLH